MPAPPAPGQAPAAEAVRSARKPQSCKPLPRATLPEGTAQRDSGLGAFISFYSFLQHLVPRILAFLSPSAFLLDSLVLGSRRTRCPRILCPTLPGSLACFCLGMERGPNMIVFLSLCERPRDPEHLLPGLPGSSSPEPGTRLPAHLPLSHFAFPIN